MTLWSKSKFFSKKKKRGFVQKRVENKIKNSLRFRYDTYLAEQNNKTLYLEQIDLYSQIKQNELN
jgi:lipopolysaccharide export LptBFGC system permease protein LptF